MEVTYTGTITCSCGHVNRYEAEAPYVVDGDSLEMRCKKCGERVQPQGRREIDQATLNTAAQVLLMTLAAKSRRLDLTPKNVEFCKQTTQAVLTAAGYADLKARCERAEADRNRYHSLLLSVEPFKHRLPPEVEQALAEWRSGK